MSATPASASAAIRGQQAAAMDIDCKDHLELVGSLQGHTDRVWCVAWSPSGKSLASCSGDTTIRIWQETAGDRWECTAVLDGTHTRTVRCIAWSPDGRYLASCSFDSTTAVWEYRSGGFECVATLSGHENEVKAVSWSASGDLIATCSRDKSVWIWASSPDNDYECISVLHGHTQDVKAVKFHPHDSQLVISASYDDTLRVWADDGDDWVCKQTLESHRGTVWAFAFDHSAEKIVSCSDDKSLVLWHREHVDQPRWRKVCQLEDVHARTIFGVDWSKHHGLIASVGADDSLVLVRETATPSSSDGDRASSLSIVHVEKGCHQGDVNGVAWHPLAEKQWLLATAGDDFAVKLWRVRTPM